MNTHRPQEPFGQWLKQHRKALDLTQADLAGQVACSVVTLQKIEAGERRPSKQVAERLADVLAIAEEERSTFLAFARHRLEGDTESHPAAADSQIIQLPPQATEFIGRERELEAISRLLATPACRLLSLVGPGGIGKTRLAIEAAGQQSGYSDGIYFVSLAPLVSPNQIMEAIAGAIGFQFGRTGDPDSQLITFLSTKSVLLVLDNFEHVRDGATLLSPLIAQAPAVNLLVTSREALNLQEEFLYPVGGLDFPEAEISHVVSECSAVRLFVGRARRIRADFTPESEAASITRICTVVEGMPLAIELAAAWVRTIPCDEIASEIEQGLDILATPLRNVPERHRNMRAVLDQSWQRLSDEEQHVFKRLSVFRGGFTRQAAQSVAGAALPVLAALVDKTFILLGADGRYGIHEMIRQYGVERLIEEGVLSSVQRQHTSFFAKFLKDRELLIRSSKETAYEIKADYDNFRAAWYWSVDHQDWEELERMMECIYRYGVGRFRAPFQKLFSDALARLDPDDQESSFIWGHLVSRYAAIYQFPEPATDDLTPQILDRALALARQEGNQTELGFCLYARGVAANCRNDDSQALIWLSESVDIYAKNADSFHQAEVYFWIARARTNFEDANDTIEIYRLSYELGRKSGHIDAQAYASINMCGQLIQLGRIEEARLLLVKTEDIVEAMDFSLARENIAILNSFIETLSGHLAAARSILDHLQARPMRERTYEIEQLIQLAILGSLEEEYEKARTYLSTDEAYWWVYWWGTATVFCGLRDFPRAKISIKGLLYRGLRWNSLLLQMMALPCQAVVLAHEGKAERAAELLGLMFRYPRTLTSWAHEWPLITRLRTQLESELGAEVYSAAWERGKASNLEAVSAALLKEFGGDKDLPPR